MRSQSKEIHGFKVNLCMNSINGAELDVNIARAGDLLQPFASLHSRMVPECWFVSWNSEMLNEERKKKAKPIDIRTLAANLNEVEQGNVEIGLEIIIPKITV